MKNMIRTLLLVVPLASCALLLSAAGSSQRGARAYAKAAGLSLHSVESGGRTRWYRVAPPPAAASYPVVVLFHGGGGNAQQAAAAYGVVEEASRRGYLAVFPEGTGKLGGPPLFKLETWNGGGCCGYAEQNDVDDVGFFADMLAQLSAEYAIDPERVFLTGMSNGAIMSYRIAVERPDLIAGLAPVAGALMVGPPSLPVPLCAIHGLLDESVPFEGGVGAGVSGADFTSQLGSVLPFLAVNGGTPLPQPLTVGAAQVFVAPAPFAGGAAGGAETWYLLALDGGHSWPGAAPPAHDPRIPVHQDVPATPLMFDFFEHVGAGR